jgi:hypothetical protein
LTAFLLNSVAPTFSSSRLAPSDACNLAKLAEFRLRFRRARPGHDQLLIELSDLAIGKRQSAGTEKACFRLIGFTGVFRRKQAGSQLLDFLIEPSGRLPSRRGLRAKLLGEIDFGDLVRQHGRLRSALGPGAQLNHIGLVASGGVNRALHLIDHARPLTPSHYTLVTPPLAQTRLAKKSSTCSP